MISRNIRSHWFLKRKLRKCTFLLLSLARLVSGCKLERLILLLFAIYLSVIAIFRSDLSMHLGKKESDLLILDADQILSSSKTCKEELSITFLPTDRMSMKADPKIPDSWPDDYSFPLDGQSCEYLRNQFDPRMMPALVLSYLSERLSTVDKNMYDSITVPFSWSSWLGLDTRLSNLFGTQSNFKHNLLGCERFKERYNIDIDNITEYCRDHNNLSGKYPRIDFFKPITSKMKAYARAVVGLSHLRYSAPIPQRILFMGLYNNNSLLVPTSKLTIPDLKDKPDLSYLLNNYLDSISPHKDGFQYETINLQNVISDVSKKLKILHDLYDKYLSSISEHLWTDDILRLLQPSTSDNELTKNSFMFNADVYYSELKEQVRLYSYDSVSNKFDQNLLSAFHLAYNSDNHPKYFYEADIIKSSTGSHYDWRFFKGIIHSEYERQALLHRLVRAWLRFVKITGIRSWLAHGTLLGWYWNGVALPWDHDIDVQMPISDFLRFARNYNQTLVVDLEDKKSISLGIGSYLIDINPYFYNRIKGNGRNTIDARFIDTETGIYVDITSLAFTDAVKEISIRGRQSIEFNRLLDHDFEDNEFSAINKLTYYDSLFSQRAQLWKNQLIYNCKNNHFYTLDDLSPLKLSLFEGVLALVPKSFKQILEREYEHGLHSIAHQGHTYDSKINLWISNDICRKKSLLEDCSSLFIKMEEMHTKRMTDVHISELLNPDSSISVKNESIPFRVDPWVIRRFYDIKERKIK